MAGVEELKTQIIDHFGVLLQHATVACGELTVTILPTDLREVCFALRDHRAFDFKLLVDVCGVDYLHYGIDEWDTQSTTGKGFSRGVKGFVNVKSPASSSRFAVVYHLLSLTHNHRIRLHVLLDESDLIVPSIMDIWVAANWYEREAFDLFGIVFAGHPDLRRILTDYGFAGHPFRKDFPLSGYLEVRYDATIGKVIYEPVTSVVPRVLEPKVIRDDNRYLSGE